MATRFNHTPESVLSALFGMDDCDRRYTVAQIIRRLDALDLVIEDLEPEEDFGVDDVGEGSELHKPLPLYGVDQTEGPTNYSAANRAHYRALQGRAQ